MLKLAAVGLWVMLVTAGATFASIYLGHGKAPDSGEQEDQGEDQLTTEVTSIPILRGGDVSGYVILQLSFAADRALLSQKKFDPLPYIKDSLFRVIFSSTDIDFRRLKAGDLDRLTDAVAQEANRRLGVALVRRVLFQQLNYVRKEDIRTNWAGVQNAAQ